MSVGEVRRNLDIVRRRWKDKQQQPFFLTDPLSGGMTVQLFSLKFVLGHHFKRHQTKRDESEKSTESEEPAPKKRRRG